METMNSDYAHIKGWGIDADPENEPTYPIKKYTGDDHQRLNWERPPLQAETVEVLHSNERPGLSAVFGTSVPPSGLSGMIRRKAFAKSESEYGHWLPLLIADRINVVEGVLDDLSRGHIPNLFAEWGWKADWKYNRKSLVTKLAVSVALGAAVVLFLSKKNQSSVAGKLEKALG